MRYNAGVLIGLRSYRRFGRDVRLYMITTGLFGFTVFGGVYSVLLNLYLLRLGHGPEAIGLINGLGQVAMALFGLPAAALGRRYGSRPMLIAGLGLAAAGHALLPAAELVRGAGLAWLFGAYVLGNLGIALYLVNGNPFLMDITKPEERSQAFAIQGGLYPLSAVLGGLAAGFLPGLLASAGGLSLERPDAFRNVLWLAAAALLPAVLAAALTRPHHGSTVVASKLPIGPAPWRIFLLFGAFVFLRLTGEGTVRGFFNVYLDAGLHAPTAVIGAWFAGGQLLAVPAALLMPAVSAALGRKRAVIWGTLGMAASLLAIALVPHVAFAGLGYVGLIVMTGLTRPLTTLFQMEIVTQQWRATMSGSALLSTGLSWGVMAAAGGYLVTRAGYASLFLVGVILTAAGAALFHLWFKEKE